MASVSALSRSGGVELARAVLAGLLHQDVGHQEPALDVVCIHQPVVVAQLALEQVVRLGKNLRQKHLHFVLHRAHAVVGLLVVTVQQVGHGPDEGGDGL